MKTLKYLMLLLAVAVALPAMAQEEKFEKKIELKRENVTEGALSKHNAYAVQVVGDELHARVISDKGTILEMVKGANGVVQKTCQAKSKAPCPPGFKYVKEESLEPVELLVREKEDFREMERESVREAFDFLRAYEVEAAS